MTPRRRRRSSPLRHALLAGTVNDIPALQAQIDSLPLCAFGQILVELPAGGQAPQLRTPPRMTVMCVRPGSFAGQPEPEGVALSRALINWVHEWMPEMPDCNRSTSIWIGAEANAAVTAHCGVLDALAQRL